MARILGRKAKAKAKAQAKVGAAAPQSPFPLTKGKKKNAPTVVTPPKTAAVFLTVEEGSAATLEGAIRAARQRIDLAALGIGALR